MLVPAVLYNDEIKRKMLEYKYTNDMMYYSGWLGDSIPNIDDDSEDNCTVQYAIVDGDNLIGYFTYMMDWYTSCASCFGLFSFDRGNKIIGLDVRREMKKIIKEYNVHRISWRMVSGNPVERHYDKFCDKYGGKKFVLTDAIRDRAGNYHDDIIYEIIFQKSSIFFKSKINLCKCPYCGHGPSIKYDFVDSGVACELSCIHFYVQSVGEIHSDAYNKAYREWNELISDFNLRNRGK
ncbi:hypothetical protein RUMCAL_00285 [Ruminococcus callidus ATCC 27760]|jgi:hypothetical protein|uniref:N-acetyltransferase domain-containing protein n=1 Tax=Ruminococcus callidus ATCC 27760 TaxID=411473 RepID=U2MD28_9FIRM|nr:hypothetical protein [Ruminococcus callidus]ERJ97213.1 hypothetical protein RUMCAL_00285 [Ruminococcus callidus ATCC 27760]